MNELGDNGVYCCVDYCFCKCIVIIFVVKVCYCKCKDCFDVLFFCCENGG